MAGIGKQLQMETKSCNFGYAFVKKRIDGRLAVYMQAYGGDASVFHALFQDDMEMLHIHNPSASFYSCARTIGALPIAIRVYLDFSPSQAMVLP